MTDSINIRYYQVANVQATAPQFREIITYCSIWLGGSDKLFTTVDDINTALIEGLLTKEVHAWLQEIQFSLIDNKAENVIFHK